LVDGVAAQRGRIFLKLTFHADSKTLCQRVDRVIVIINMATQAQNFLHLEAGRLIRRLNALGFRFELNLKEISNYVFFGGTLQGSSPALKHRLETFISVLLLVSALVTALVEDGVRLSHLLYELVGSKRLALLVDVFHKVASSAGPRGVLVHLARLRV